MNVRDKYRMSYVVRENAGRKTKRKIDGRRREESRIDTASKL